MALNKRNIFKKLPRFLRRLLCMLGMAPNPPSIPGVFTAYGEKSYFCHTITPWYTDTIRNNPDTSDCLVFEVGWYKMQNGVKHEFVRFDIYSPDKVHKAIIIAERTGGSTGPDEDPDDATGADTTRDATTPPISSPDVAEDSPVGSADDSSSHVEEAPTKSPKTKKKEKGKVMRTGENISMSTSSPMAACDRASHATSDSSAGGVLENKYRKADCIRTLTFRGVAPTANEIATLLYVTSKHEPKYRIHETQCYWFAATVFEALECIFFEAKANGTKHSGGKGKWHGIPVPTKESVDEVCDEYLVLRRALDREIELKRRAEQRQEEDKRRDREERRAAEERARAAEEVAQWEREEKEREREEKEREREEKERARAAEEREREQRRAAEEKIAQLLRQLEASGAGASTSQV
ncbi:hypothetical protein BKA83DRAFT_4278359 [Pisolithus microcarpus]|nr:hypothetical protein BKA83DRAFT_4278359 [Pisolithus microcarpus]